MLQKLFHKFRIIRSSPVLLGRWCRTEQNLNNVKVDLANIDHCGTCVLDKKMINKTIVPDNKTNTDITALVIYKLK
jgi:hypothetical protein